MTSVISHTDATLLQILSFIKSISNRRSNISDRHENIFISKVIFSILVLQQSVVHCLLRLALIKIQDNTRSEITGYIMLSSVILASKMTMVSRDVVWYCLHGTPLVKPEYFGTDAMQFELSNKKVPYYKLL